MAQDQELDQGSPVMVYTPKELAKRLGLSDQWVYDHIDDLPGAKETFPGSGKFIFNKRIIDEYYGW